MGHLRHSVIIKDSNNELKQFPLKDWVRQNQNSLPNELDGNQTSHKMRQILKRNGWSLVFTETEVFVIRPDENGNIDYANSKIAGNQRNDTDEKKYINISKEDIEPEICFIDDIKISDIPSSLHWKEIFDFAKTFDLNKVDKQSISDQANYLEKFYRNHNKIDSNSIHEMRAVLLQFINMQKLVRDKLPTKEQMIFLKSIINTIYRIVYDKMWSKY